ncbi:MAG: cotH 3 [Verrucomicrobiales bacterium]|nr:cotH 3 [Verrucomicrobiales bacterium]
MGLSSRVIGRLMVLLCMSFGGFLSLPAAESAAKQTVKGDAELLFQDKLVPRIQVEISPEGMEVLRNYHQVWGKPRPERVDVRATLREGGHVYTNVALHLKGSYSFQAIDAKPSLTLNFDKGNHGQSFHGLGKIHLNNSVQDPTYFSEKFARELFREVGVPSTRVGHALVEINGRNTGLYILVEGWSKSFLKQHFSSAKGNLYDGGSGGDITKELKVESGEDPDDRAAVTNLIAACRIKDPSARRTRLAELLDLDRFINFAATEVFLVHWDGYCMGPNNYKLFHDVSRNKMVFMPHGLDQTFEVSRSSSISITPHFNGTVAKALLSIPEERKRFLDRLASLSTNEFRYDLLSSRLQQMAAPLRTALASEPDVIENMQASLVNMQARMAQRCQSVADQLRNPTKPLALTPGMEIPLRSWSFKTGITKPASGRRTRQDGKDLLQVLARNGDSTGSWRASVLLESGLYEISGDARVQGLGNAPGTNGVIIRASGERSTKGISINPEWKHFRYDFEVRGIEDVELVCEFRGPKGMGEFDVSSLKLSRKDAKKD